jgi:hypothetical protein
LVIQTKLKILLKDYKTNRNHSKKFAIRYRKRSFTAQALQKQKLLGWEAKVNRSEGMKSPI